MYEIELSRIERYARMAAQAACNDDRWAVGELVLQILEIATRVNEDMEREDAECLPTPTITCDPSSGIYSGGSERAGV